MFYLLFLVIHYGFLHIEVTAPSQPPRKPSQLLMIDCALHEPFEEISDMQSNIKNFIVGMSPACLDSEYDCLGLDDIHSWETAAIWCAYCNFTRAKG